MPLLKNITSLFTAPGQVGVEPAAPADAVSALMQTALETARTTAQADGRIPSLEDYRQACVALGEKQGLAATEWNPKIYADLSGRDVSGFSLSDPAARSTTGLLDLDSDGAINDFYTNIDFTGANLKNCYVQPATSFNGELAKAKSLQGITFDGMQHGESFVFGSGQYHDIKMVNVKGGTLEFAPHTQVDGLDIRGAEAAITLSAHARISGITVDKSTRILTLDMKPDPQGGVAEIAYSDLSTATIDMASNLAGSKWNNVTFGPNLQHVDFHGATMTNITIAGQVEKTGLAGLDLSGAHITNLSINGEVMTSVKMLQEKYNVTVDADTHIGATEDVVRAAKVEQALAKATKVAEEASRGWLGGAKPSTPDQAVASAGARPADKGESVIPANYYAPNQGRNT